MGVGEPVFSPSWARGGRFTDVHAPGRARDRCDDLLKFDIDILEKERDRRSGPRVFRP